MDEKNSLPGFEDVESKMTTSKEYSFPYTNDHDNDIMELRVKDLKWIIRHRHFFAYGVGALLISQNIFIFSFVFCAWHMGDIRDIQIITSILVTGVLGETFFVLHFIVRRMFEKINYVPFNKL